MIEWIQHGSSKSFKKVPVGAHITAVNGKIVIALCENCNKPIYESSDYTAWEDDIYTHKKCTSQLQE
jgi:hypothetical protein